MTDNREQPAGGVETERLEAMLAGCEGAQGGPWKLDKFAVYVWAPSEKGGDFPVMDDPGKSGRVVEMRGWGYYTGHGHGALGLDPDEATRRIRLTGEHVARLDPQTVASIITELLAYRRRPPADAGKADSGEAKPIAWRCEDLILPGVSFTDDARHAAARADAKAPDGSPAWLIQPLYASPTPPVPVSEDAVEAASLCKDAAELQRLVADANATATPVLGGPEGESILAYSIPTGTWLMLQAEARLLTEKLLSAPHMARGDQGAGAVETGWLIEQRGSLPTWYSLRGEGFSGDSLAALRFARKEDAEAYIEDIGWTECFASEHMWSDPPVLKRAVGSATPTDQVTALVEAGVYESAVKGRADFREAYRRLLPIKRAAEALIVKWRTPGQMVDSKDWFDAIEELDRALAKAPAPDDTTPAKGD